MNFKFKLKFNKREVSNHLLFCYFSYSMKGKIYRVTHNILKQEAELHLEDGEVLNVPMTDDEWKEMIKGDVVSNFQELLDTFEKECEKEVNKGPYLLDPVTEEKTYYE